MIFAGPEKMRVFLAAVVLSAPMVAALVRKDGTGKLPAMGWNSWNTYLCDINATLFLDQAQAMLDHRLHVRHFPKSNPSLLEASINKKATR